ncbi:aldehyde dehydrogenase family protein [bacterium]|nr:aldehyde dehydrogenase family protein [bacterium]
MQNELLRRMGVETASGVCGRDWYSHPRGAELVSINPATGEELCRVQGASSGEYDEVIDDASGTFKRWRNIPAPVRGEVVRQLGAALRQRKNDLGRLVTMETGKIISEGLGEVQEMIDMCDFAVGLSRQLYGLTIASERSEHRMMEQWHPLGTVGIITAFNFPVAVWSWNAAIAAVCGNVSVWKPSPRTPLTSLAVQQIASDVARSAGHEGIFTLCNGGTDIGERLSADRRVPLVSATGSCAMGKKVAATVGARLGRSLLELGGNNSAIITPSANLDLALRAVLFAAVGTAGQRCTTLRRLFLHQSIAEDFTERLVKAYRSIRIGDPLDESTLMGPLISSQAVDAMMMTLQLAKDQGGSILTGGERINRPGYFVEPTIVRATHDMPVVHQETFAPILYVMSYESLDDAIEWNNEVPQGLSSSIFTDSVIDSETFLSPAGSDCGIANVNIGTSGAEIGGAFGGEKETGGGREAGSDAWKAYMRRQTCTINGGRNLPLAQGVKFDL